MIYTQGTRVRITGGIRTGSTGAVDRDVPDDPETWVGVDLDGGPKVFVRQDQVKREVVDVPKT